VGEEDIMGTGMDGTVEAGEVEVAIDAGVGDEGSTLISKRRPIPSSSHIFLRSFMSWTR
jgi:hypothetical protein